MGVFVFGTGCGAGDLADSVLPPERIEAFVSEREAETSFLGRPVIAPEALREREIELLIVASRDAEAVERRLQALGVAPEKLLFLKNHLRPTDRNRSYEAARRILGEAYVQSLQDSERLIRVPLWSEREKICGDGAGNDYVRLKTLEALCRELGALPGAAAELGVYRGGFARWINLLLPERTLYLFDSFSGFDARESAGCGEGFLQAHRNTAAEEVLAVLPHPESARLRPGLFPGTAGGLEEERFCLVSLDADLEESTLQGLRWFVPRMVPGGYVLLHDFNNPKLPGVRSALRRYERERGARLPAVPICDVNGTLVICVS